ncbi:MAG: Uma2 family endonuclease [Granulosicoccus sp.]
MHAELDATASHSLISVEHFRALSGPDTTELNSNVELIDGVIYDLPPDADIHANVLDRLIEEVINGCANQAIVRVQSTIELGSLSALMPDISLIRRNAQGNAPAVPSAQDALVVMEVVDDALPYFYETKSELYAYHGIPELWLLDIPNRRFTLFREPSDKGYQQKLDLSQFSSLSPRALPEVSINIARVLETMAG